ncbi:hydroxymethylglutaryl-CoA lyase [Silvibacterium dinghuense]|uniref:Hydroxymethylglutaryl-CoA lyase n=1 Tax=Silvibacterium dinghuense TaxID=1560006 RepID=A0A4Q1SER0_9BACT|nr:hydroxymethylglutaryl-CoA lyase [Silvibacterium dinghuense]
MSNQVKLIECPRDAWQGLPKPIPVEIKADYLKLLFAAGFKHVDAVSFVSPKAVPQMADAEQVLAFAEAPRDVEIIGIVVNKKGAERAIATNAVTTLGFPYSISPEFLRRNQNQTPEESIDALDAVGEAAYKAGLGLAVYVSMAFGNPYGDTWDVGEVIAACELLADTGIEQISLADTVGLATPEQVGTLFAEVRTSLADEIELGVHLHARPEAAAEKVRAAYEAGCRRFDSVIGGIGGCPFAQDALVGNIATETVLAELARLGAELPKLEPLDSLIRVSQGIGQKFGTAAQ